MRNTILKHVRSASSEALNYMKTFSKYEYIWLEDKQLYLQRFLNECERKCLEENDFIDNKMQDPNAQIEVFQAQVSINFTIYLYFKNKISMEICSVFENSNFRSKIG